MTTLTSHLATRLGANTPSPAPGSGSGNIPPNLGVTMQHDLMPWQRIIVDIAGAIQASALVVLGILLVFAILGALAGKFAKSSILQQIGWGVAIACAVGALLVGASFAIVAWAAGLEHGF
ncbi:MAG: hypothetical protein FWD83_00305 [Promicromonosporaceae bacterium]|nr:hypothetical protein [Promicromonosporaceae bacterium]